MKKLSLFAVVLGILLALAGGVLRLVIAPAVAVLPGNTNTTRTYAGTASTLLNTTALTTGGQALLRNVPITVVHQTKVLQTKGDNAFVLDARTMSALGQQLASISHRYAVDRTDLARGSGFGDAEHQTGLTFNWPIRTDRRDYTGWVSDTQSTTSLRYAGEARRGGVKTYLFTTSTTPKLITDPQVLRSLPTAIPKATLAKLVGQLALPAAQVSAFGQLLPSLPDPVRFAFTYQLTARYWVAPDSGIVVDVDQHEVRAIALPGGAAPTPLATVMDTTFTSTPATLAAAANDARSKGSDVHQLFVTGPLWLLASGILLLVLGIGGMVVDSRRPPTAPQVAPESASRVPVAR